MEPQRISFFELVDKLYQLAKFNGGSFTLKSGSIKRVFIEEEHDEAVIMYSDGGGDYANDAGGLAVFTAISNFEYEYPEAYKKFMEVYETHDESKETIIGAEDIKNFKKIINMAFGSKPS